MSVVVVWLWVDGKCFTPTERVWFYCEVASPIILGENRDRMGKGSIFRRNIVCCKMWPRGESRRGRGDKKMYPHSHINEDNVNV